jgi:hypothetical protein
VAVRCQNSGSTPSGIPSGLSRFPFEWRILVRDASAVERIFPMELLGGFVGVAQDPKTGREILAKTFLKWARALGRRRR